MIKRFTFVLMLHALALLMSSCSTREKSVANPDWDAEDGPPINTVIPDAHQVADAVPRKEPRSKYGNPKSYVVFGQRYYVLPTSINYKERGIASWYGTKFHGKRTSSGEAYDMYAMTAAHKTLPLPTYVKVTNLSNQREVILKVNDRGPFHDNRIIDLSHTAATKLGIIGSGTGLVEVEAIDPETWQQIPSRTTIKQNAMSAPVELYLQLGAFISAENAHNLKLKIKKLTGQSAFISKALNNRQMFYRVRIGPVSSVTESDLLTEQFKQKGFGQPGIVIE